MSAIAPAIGRRREASLAPNYIVLILLLAFAVGPLVVLSFNSLKTTAACSSWEGWLPTAWPSSICRERDR